MATCTDCSAALQPQWKFCVRCGAFVEREIPAAIRPEQVDEPAHIAPLTIFLWSLGGLLAVITIVGVTVALFFTG